MKKPLGAEVLAWLVLLSYQESSLLDPFRTWHVQPPNFYMSLLFCPPGQPPDPFPPWLWQEL